MKIVHRGNVVTVCMDGEIDHCSAKVLKEKIESAIFDPGVNELRLDFSRVEFMDSSGVGMLIGRYRTMAQRGGMVTASGLSPSMERLFRFAGLHRIIAIENAKEDTENE